MWEIVVLENAASVALFVIMEVMETLENTGVNDWTNDRVKIEWFPWLLRWPLP